MFGIELVAFLAFDCYCMWDFHLPLFLDMNDYRGHNILPFEQQSPRNKRKRAVSDTLLCNLERQVIMKSSPYRLFLCPIAFIYIQVRQRWSYKYNLTILINLTQCMVISFYPSFNYINVQYVIALSAGSTNITDAQLSHMEIFKSDFCNKVY